MASKHDCRTRGQHTALPALALWVLAQVCHGPVQAQTLPTRTEADFGGNFINRSVDGLEQLVILKNHTFCYLGMAGVLDQRAAGRWKPTTGVLTAANGQELAFAGIDLLESRPDTVW